jgi:hypothetical protein
MGYTQNCGYTGVIRNGTLSINPITLHDVRPSVHYVLSLNSEDPNRYFKAKNYENFISDRSVLVENV